MHLNNGLDKVINQKKKDFFEEYFFSFFKKVTELINCNKNLICTCVGDFLVFQVSIASSEHFLIVS
jgi:hypothetical protein